MSSTINPILSLRPPAKVLCVVGTRPEAIKLAPVIQALSAAPWASCRTVHTGQHRDLVKPILDFFGIRPHVTLDVMRPQQPLPELMARMIDSLRGAIATERPKLVLAQGDTASLLAAARPGELLTGNPLRSYRGRPAHRKALRPLPRRGKPGRRNPSGQHSFRPHAHRPGELDPGGDTP